MDTTRLERAIRAAVRPIALLITLALLLGHTAYDLGRLLRLAIEDRSQQLAALHCRLLGLATSPAAPAAVAPAPAPVQRPTPTLRPVPLRPALPPVAMACAPAHRPAPVAAVAAPPLAGLTVAQLRTLARSRGHRGAKVRDARRADLLQLLG